MLTYRLETIVVILVAMLGTHQFDEYETSKTSNDYCVSAASRTIMQQADRTRTASGMELDRLMSHSNPWQVASDWSFFTKHGLSVVSFDVRGGMPSLLVFSIKLQV